MVSLLFGIRSLVTLSPCHPVTLSPRHLATLSLAIVGILTPAAAAHPVDLGVYDRTIEVRLSRERLSVHYHLELSEATACLDLEKIGERKELNRLTKREEYHEAFLRTYAPILADRLAARLDGKALALTCVRRSLQAKDHLYCDFVFEAPWDLQPGRGHQFTFRD